MVDKEKEDAIELKVLNMKSAVVILITWLVISSPFNGFPLQTEEPVIVAGKGWGKVNLGISKTEVENIMGITKPHEENDSFSVGYADKGLIVIFSKKNKSAETIYFFNKDRGYESYERFQGKTSKGIDWSSTEEAVIRAYGKPKEDYSGMDEKGRWRRIVFEGIDFRFINGSLVRIGIPGD